MRQFNQPSSDTLESEEIRELRKELARQILANESLRNRIMDLELLIRSTSRRKIIEVEREKK